MLEDRVNQSELIIEGRVLGKSSFKFNELIYTNNLIEVCQVIYTNSAEPASEVLPFNIVNIVTCGGNLGEEFTNCSHVLELQQNEEGLFFVTTQVRFELYHPLL